MMPGFELETYRERWMDNVTYCIIHIIITINITSREIGYCHQPGRHCHFCQQQYQYLRWNQCHILHMQCNMKIWCMFYFVSATDRYQWDRLVRTSSHRGIHFQWQLSDSLSNDIMASDKCACDTSSSDITWYQKAVCQTSRRTALKQPKCMSQAWVSRAFIPFIHVIYSSPALGCQCCAEEWIRWDSA